jgi:hypothetical protein
MGRRLVEKAMKSAASQNAPRALTLLESAVFMLRRSSTALAAYYLGSFPFVLALLFFWSDMSRNPFASWYNAPAAFGLAVLFVWMKVWHVRYCRMLWHALEGTALHPWPLRRLLSVVSRQTVLHASAMVVLPLAMITAVPLAWVYAFYQNLSVLEDMRTKTVGTIVRKAIDQAVLWPGQNHLILAVVGLFGSIVLLNLRTGMLLLPYLVKWLLGVDSVFTLSGAHLLNTTYLAILFALTYLLIDPIIKAVYVLRCFYGTARFSGADLRAVLRPFLQITLLLLLVFGGCLPSSAGQDSQPLKAKDERVMVDQRAEVKKLDRVIESTLKQRRFAWRLPESEDPAQQPDQSWLVQTLSWIGDTLRPVYQIVGGWIKDFFGWIKKSLPDPKLSRPESAQNWSRPIRLIFYLLGIGLICILIFSIVRWLIRRRSQTEPHIELEATPCVDIDDDSVTADELPADEWLSLADDLISEKAYRKALRALYLSILAILADQQRLVIARYKSNRDYISELSRRAHAEPELLKGFRWCVYHFERTWYGLHPVSISRIDQFKTVRERITHGVQNQV